MPDLEQLPIQGIETDESKAEAPPENKAEIAEQLQQRLDGIVTANNELESTVTATAVEIGADIVLQDPEVAANDTGTMLETLSAIEPSEVQKLADQARALQQEVKAMPGDTAKAKVEQFCQKTFGGSLADTLQALGELTLPGTDLTILRKVFGGKMPTGKDVARLATKMIAPPLGEIAFKLCAGTDNKDIRQQVVKGRLGAELIKVLSTVMPEAAVVARPAAAVLDSVTHEIDQLSRQTGKVSIWDQVKAIGRGLLPKDQETAKSMVKAMAGDMLKEAVLGKLGISGEAASAMKFLGGIMDQHPDKTIQVLYKVFADGGIAGETIDMANVPGSDGGIVERQEPPAGAMYAA